MSLVPASGLEMREPACSSIFESGSALLSCVCELVRYARAPQSRDAWRRRVPRARGDARPDDDDARQRGDERQRCDDALERDALVIGPSEVPPCLMEFNSQLSHRLFVPVGGGRLKLAKKRGT